ncbi:hypothetical protein Rsub_05776 [Raphidocelis subcapitata]|uniref:Tubulin/FtsZ GTPase domain-containing protein n=1 Tax=Raphidocelis subcapitata TaxID=307507 RepID=A0A2V0P512_9CHLO|nr:hypothetical protein Rsub_05776 [Raphidocelis subcapitata]|eukprot:GBF92940.1 hypothetical protein Rsub_05776 [Raphidocelis subcapitata]
MLRPGVLCGSSTRNAPGTAVYATEASPSVYGKLKIVGVGARGISAISRLMGNNLVPGGEFWAVDTDVKLLASCEAPHTIQVPAEDDAALAAADLRRLAGPAAAPAVAGAAAAGAPATAGVAFLLAAAGGVPGGSPMLLQTAAYLRRSGYFVVAALTRPFEFEGRRRLEEADALIEALCDVAQLTVVVAQGVLQRASAELTIQQASAIADNTLEFSVRSALWALGAPEVLRASQGGMAWHGRDLRQYKRLLSPPLERLLTCPGTAALGRGLASIPVSSLEEAGLPSTLSTLAEDAVTAAADSPFLDAAMGAAGGVMVVLSLPPRVLHHRLDGEALARDDPEKYAIRAAVQVAAATVLDLAGRACHDVVACAHVRATDWPHDDPDCLCLEATMLVLEDPAALEAAAAAAESSSYPYITPRRPPGAGTQTPPPPRAPGGGGGLGGERASTATPLLGGTGKEAVAAAAQQQQQQQQQSAGKQQQQAPSAPRRANWNAMSALAGGSAAAAHTLRPAAPASPAPPRPGSSAGGSGEAPGPASSSSGPNAAGPAQPAAGSSGRASPPTRPQPRGPSPLVGRAPDRGAGPASPANRPATPAAGGEAAGGGGEQQRARSAAASPSLGPPQLIPRMADRLVDSLVAQSLDLPPNAARWRHRQRSKQAAPARRGGAHFQLGPLVSGGSAAGGAAGGVGAAAGAGPEPPADLRSRVAGMLEQEREDAFDAFAEEGEEEEGAGGGGAAPGAGGRRGA